MLCVHENNIVPWGTGVRVERLVRGVVKVLVEADRTGGLVVQVGNPDCGLNASDDDARPKAVANNCSYCVVDRRVLAIVPHGSNV